MQLQNVNCFVYIHIKENALINNVRLLLLEALWKVLLQYLVFIVSLELLIQNYTFRII
jgi:hypothetical protein